MIYQFDCDEVDAATAALIVYATWRSRDKARFKITPDVWGQVERAVKASAKRATTLPRFIEALKPKLLCATLHPRALAVGLSGDVRHPADPVYDLTTLFDAPAEPQPDEGRREFLTGALRACDERATLDLLYRETAWIVLLVRDRLERERPVEARIEAALGAEGDGGAA